MKKRTLLIILAAILLISGCIFAAGGAEDPLASRSYLEQIFSKTVQEQVDQKLDASDASIRSNLQNGTIQQIAATWTETRLKYGDTLQGVTGTNVILLAGSASVFCEDGTVIDVTAGTPVPSGSALTLRHRYMTAEDSTAVFSVTSKTAVLDYQGEYAFTYSNAVDYTAMAEALKTLKLFLGSNTGYGSGFDLEDRPSRLQAIIMFVRLLGEEEQALAWSGTMPFTDVTHGSLAEKYVGYAYEKGYTNGYTPTQFRPANKVNAYQYAEFILRAMGYSSAQNTNISDALDRAVDFGIITDGEADMLKRDLFLRAELVYLSYYTLQARLPDSAGTLSDTLIDKGVFTAATYAAALQMVPGQRL